jgi:hypothetical protein
MCLFRSRCGFFRSAMVIGLAVLGSCSVKRNHAPVESAPNLKEEVVAIRRYIEQRYDEIIYFPDGSSRIVGVAYTRESEPPRPISGHSFLGLLPETRFYTATLQTPYYEWPSMTVLVSVRSQDGGTEIRSCESPTMRCGLFLHQFSEIPMNSDADKRKVAMGVAGLLARLWHDTSVRAADPGSRTYAEIWSRENNLLDVKIEPDKFRGGFRIYVSEPFKSRDDKPAVEPSQEQRQP